MDPMEPGTPRPAKSISAGCWKAAPSRMSGSFPAPRAAPAFPIAGNWYGTTLRVYDPSISAWRISWFDPARCVFRQQIGRSRGEDIVQEGTTDAGDLTRWSFTEITDDSFLWLGEVKPAAAADWRLVVDVRAKRREG